MRDEWFWHIRRIKKWQTSLPPMVTKDDGALTRKKMIGDRLMMKIEKICLFCKYFVFQPGEPDWSEVTPGYDAEIKCRKYHWSIDMMEDSTKSYRRKILTAETCADYEFDTALLEDNK